MDIKIIPNDKGVPAGKLADAELVFIDGELAGLKLVGFTIWQGLERGEHNVTFPARQYSLNGERRTFALPRPVLDASALDRVREQVLDAFAEFERQAAVTTGP